VGSRRSEVLVVSDDPVLRSLLRDLLERERGEVSEAADPDTALSRCHRDGPAVVLIDAIAGDPGMLGLLGRLEGVLADRQPAVLLLVGSGAPPDVEQHALVQAWLRAPFRTPALVETVQDLLGRQATARSHTRLRVDAPDDGSEADGSG